VKCVIDDNDLEALGINLPKVVDTENGYETITEINDKIEINGVQYILDKTMPANIVINVGVVYPYKCESDRTYVKAFKEFLRSMQIRMINKGTDKFGTKKFRYEDEEVEVSFTLQNRKEVLYIINRYGSIDEDIINLDDYETAYDLLKELRVI